MYKYIYSKRIGDQGQRSRRLIWTMFHISSSSITEEFPCVLKAAPPRPPGGDHRWCLHGGVRVARQKWKAARPRDRPHGARPAGRRAHLQDLPPGGAAAEAPHWHPQRWGHKCVLVHRCTPIYIYIYIYIYSFIHSSGSVCVYIFYIYNIYMYIFLRSGVCIYLLYI